MKYKTKIVPRDGKYIGYVMFDNNVVFSSNAHKDTVMVAREISSYIAEATQNIPAPAPVQKQTVLNPVPSSNMVPVIRAGANSVQLPPASNPVPFNAGVPVTRTETNPAVSPVRTASVSNNPAPRRCCGR